MTKLLVAVECDFGGYQPFSARNCEYDHAQCIDDIQQVLNLVQSECGGKAAFLIHTSPFIRRNYDDIFYTSKDYLSIWSDAVSGGAELGLHLHEEEPDGSCLYYGYKGHLEKVISSHVKMLSEAGMVPTCESTGYFGTNEWFVSILEANGLFVNLDNIGKFTEITVRDWSVSPLEPYFLNPTDVTCMGDSKILSVPLGMTEYCRGEDGLMASGNNLRYLRELWQEINRTSSPERTCHFWIEAHRIRRDEKKIVSFLSKLKADGVQFVTPSEVYSNYVSALVTDNNRGVS